MSKSRIRPVTKISESVIKRNGGGTVIAVRSLDVSAQGDTKRKALKRRRRPMKMRRGPKYSSLCITGVFNIKIKVLEGRLLEGPI